ncbi:regulatory protein RecX [Anaerospora hongkongensis]|uniref:regulatory protein RecX n=1 Tax=Anaerospora hongkongensis TaxID=244830 RepID=UPI0035E3D528
MIPNSSTALQDAVKMLAGRSLSEKELREKLKRKGWDEQEVAAALHKLRLRGYVNDEALCRQLFASYAGSKRHGVKYILAKLKSRGLDLSLIQDDIADYNYQDEYSRALALAQRKFAGQTELVKHKMARFLLARGFADSTVVKVINEITRED